MKNNYSDYLIKNINRIEYNFNILKDKKIINEINIAANILVNCIKNKNKI